MDYSFTKSADKSFKKLPIETQKRIIRKLEGYLSCEQPLIFATRSTGIKGHTYRYRFGSYRVVFEIASKSEILVLVVGHRKDIYK